MKKSAHILSRGGHKSTRRKSKSKFWHNLMYQITFRDRDRYWYILLWELHTRVLSSSLYGLFPLLVNRIFQKDIITQ